MAKPTTNRKTRQTVARHRTLQRQTARKDARHPPIKAEKAVQAGARPYPEPPFPRQHQTKPGRESRLDPAPMYEAPYYKGSQKLRGKVALITGGNSGIGRAVAVLFAREGADVAIVHLAETADAEVTRQAVEAEGARCLVMAGDVTDRKFCRLAVRRTIDGLGGLNVLVNNAAFQLHTYRLEDLTEAHFDRTMKTNLYGYFHMAQAAVPHMKEGDAIVNNGSVTGLRGSKALLDYSTTKGGIHAFTKSLASHLLPRGIRVNAVAPGPVWTPLNPADKQAKDVAKFGADTRHEAPSPTRGNRAGLRVPRLAALLELHHRRSPAGHRRQFGLEPVDGRDLRRNAELARAERPVPRLLQVEDHVGGEAGGLVVVLSVLGGISGRELRAVALERVGHEGAQRELKASVKGAAAAVDRACRRTPASAFAGRQLLQEAVLALLDFLFASIGDGIARRDLRAVARACATRRGEHGGDEHKPDDGAEKDHNPPLFPQIEWRRKPRRRNLPARCIMAKARTRRELPANNLTAEQVRDLLKLEPNQTCGFVRVTYISHQKISAERPTGSALYFLVTPQAPVQLHRIRNDQLYHYYRGDPLELLLMKVDGSTEKVVIGPDIAAGQHVQFFIPGDTFHTARVIGERQWFLGGSTEWPGVIPADVEIGDADVLAKKYPTVAAELRSFPQPPLSVGEDGQQQDEERTVRGVFQGRLPVGVGPIPQREEDREVEVLPAEWSAESRRTV